MFELGAAEGVTVAGTWPPPLSSPWISLERRQKASFNSWSLQVPSLVLLLVGRSGRFDLLLRALILHGEGSSKHGGCLEDDAVAITPTEEVQEDAKILVTRYNSRSRVPRAKSQI